MVILLGLAKAAHCTWRVRQLKSPRGHTEVNLRKRSYHRKQEEEEALAWAVHLSLPMKGWSLFESPIYHRQISSILDFNQNLAEKQ